MVDAIFEVRMVMVGRFCGEVLLLVSWCAMAVLVKTGRQTESDYIKRPLLKYESM